MSGQSVQSVDRTLDLIELLATSPEGMGITEMGLKLNLHKSTVHRLINVLVRRGYIEKDQTRGQYRIGFKFLEISSLRLHQLELKTEAAPVMRRLAEITGQVTHLAILDGIDVVYIDKIDVVQSLRLYSQIGKRIPAYCSALGKVLLTGQSLSGRKELLQSMEMRPFTENTLKEEGKLLDEIEKAGRNGFAVDNEEHEMGIRCIAAPIKDFTRNVIAAVSVSGDRRIIRPEQDEKNSRLVMEAAAEISVKMGYSESLKK